MRPRAKCDGVVTPAYNWICHTIPYVAIRVLCLLPSCQQPVLRALSITGTAKSVKLSAMYIYIRMYRGIDGCQSLRKKPHLWKFLHLFRIQQMSIQLQKIVGMPIGIVLSPARMNIHCAYITVWHDYCTEDKWEGKLQERLLPTECLKKICIEDISHLT